MPVILPPAKISPDTPIPPLTTKAPVFTLVVGVVFVIDTAIAELLTVPTVKDVKVPTDVILVCDACNAAWQAFCSIYRGYPFSNC